MRNIASQHAFRRGEAFVPVRLRQIGAGFFIHIAIMAESAVGQSDPRSSSEVTYSRDVAAILYARCVACHHAGGSAPFELTTYEDARKRARQIAEVVRSRFMPPWLPEPGFGEFAHNRRLCESERDAILKWVEQGAAEGDPADVPPPPSLVEGWQLGQPDLVIQMPEPYLLPADGPNVFRNFVIPVDVPETRYVRKVEFHMGNSRLIHHANLKIDLRRSARRAEAHDAEPGFEGMDFVDAEFPDGFILGWTPGMTYSQGNEDLAWRLPRGADLILMLHMLPSGKPEQVQASIGLYFADRPPRQTPYSLRLGSQTIDIPSGESAYTVEDRYVLPVDVDATAIYPHAHYLGSSIMARATTPDGTVLPLLLIKRWDFNWQDEYYYESPVALPKGSTIFVRLTYDNSAANPMNPSHPPRRVVYGPQSDDEMGDVWIQVLPRDPQELGVLIDDFKRKELLAEIAGLEQMVRLKPAACDDRAALAQRYIAAGRVDEAVSQLRSALDVNPQYPAGHCNLGVVLQMRGESAEAVDHFDRALQTDPDYAEAHLNLGLALQSQGKPAEAMTHLRRAAELKPDLGAARAAMANMLSRNGLFSEAIEHYRAALAISPDDHSTRQNYAVTLLDAGDASRAIGEFRTVLDANPKLVEAHIGMAQALSKVGRREESLAHDLEALKLRPDHPAPMAGAAWIFATHPDAKWRRPDQALRFAEYAARLTQYRDANILDTLAAAYASAGAFDQAIDTENRAIETARNSGAATTAINEYIGRLQLYQRGTAYVEPVELQGPSKP